MSRTPEQKIEAYKLLLRKKQELDTSISTTEALINEKNKALKKKMDEVTERYGVSSYDDLVKRRQEKEAEIDAILARAEQEGLIPAV